jgi:hypothetical protein
MRDPSIQMRLQQTNRAAISSEIAGIKGPLDK